MIVVDASVLATALGDDGPDGDLARARLRGERLSAPELVDLEVTSVLRRQVHSGAANLRRAALALADLAALPLRRAPHRPLLSRCWELHDNLTVYDASYVALAEALEVTLLTGDGRLARAPGLRCHVEILRPTPLSRASPSFLSCRRQGQAVTPECLAGDACYRAVVSAAAMASCPWPEPERHESAGLAGKPVMLFGVHGSGLGHRPRFCQPLDEESGGKDLLTGLLQRRQSVSHPPALAPGFLDGPDVEIVAAVAQPVAGRMQAG